MKLKISIGINDMSLSLIRGLFCERVETRSSDGILQDLGVTILSVILRRIILGKNCTALPLEVGARPSRVDHGGRF